MKIFNLKNKSGFTPTPKIFGVSLPYKRGFTIVETLIAISVFSISVVVMMTILADGISDTNYTQDKLVANYLAQEGVEYMRSLRDTMMLYDANGSSGGWEAFKSKLIAANCHQANGCYFEDDLNYALSTESIKNLDMFSCGGSCPLLSYNASTGKYGYNGATVGFRRKINLQVINVNEVKVSSTVYWTQGSGTYNITFNENLFNWMESAVVTLPTAVDVDWTNAANVSVVGNTITKIGGANGQWDAGAVSRQTINSGNGYVEFSINDNNKYRMAGLGNGNSNNSYTDIEFAIYPSLDGNVYVYESGTPKTGVLGTYVANDVFRVSVESGAVKYYKNGVLLYTSLVAPTYPLLMDTSIFYINDAIKNAKIYTGLGATPPPTGTIGRDSVSTKAWGSALSWSHTNTGNFLFVTVRSDADTISGVTYNGVAMTLSDALLVNSTWRYYTYYLVNPSTGTNTISVSTSAANIAGSAVSYSNVRTSNPISTKTNGNPPHTLTTTVNNSWSLFFCADRTGVSPGASTNTTVLSQPGAGASMTLFDSNGPISPTGAFTQNCTVGSPNNAAMYVIAP